MPSPRTHPRGRGGQRGPTASVTTRAAAQAEAGSRDSRVSSIREEPSSDSSDQAGGFGMPASPTSLEARMDRVLSMLEEQKQSLARQFQEQKSAQEQAAARLEQ